MREELSRRGTEDGCSSGPAAPVAASGDGGDRNGGDGDGDSPLVKMELMNMVMVNLGPALSNLSMSNLWHRIQNSPVSKN